MGNNPFLVDGYLEPWVSLNAIYLGSDEFGENKGKRMHDLVSPKYLAELIRRDIKNLDIENIKDNRDLIIDFQNCLSNKSIEVKKHAEDIVRKYSKNIAFFLRILKDGVLYKNLKEDWENKHWEYMSNIKNIIFAGGICSEKKGQKIKEYLSEESFLEKGYNFKIFKNSRILPRLGVARLAEKACENSIVLDFGHSFVKRSVGEYKNGILENVHDFEVFYSKYLEEDIEGMKEKAESLFEYMIEIIKKTKEDIEKDGIKNCEEVLISIANYIKKGEIALKGGYGKLALLTDRLDKLIEEKLNEIYKKDFKVKIIHDGSAAALFFNEMKDTAVIMLGTGIGIGFTEMEYDLCGFNKNLMEFL